MPPPTIATTTTNDASSSPSKPRPRRLTTTSAEDIDAAIIHPGSVRINVEGAFIVDSDATSPGGANVGAGAGTTTPSSHETSDIRLPNHTAVVSHIAIDIGGTLAKLVYFTHTSNPAAEPGGRLTFLNFETDRIDDCIAFMKDLRDRKLALNGAQPADLIVMATGGGAYKFYDKIRDSLGVNVLREDEMECLIIGLDFFITEIPREVFTYSDSDPMQFAEPSNAIYPYLLVNIGSGVSFLKVSGPRKYERVGGTSLGGGTLWGLLSLLTGARTFDDMLDMAERGDNARVDMLVGDIYGTDYNKIGLKSTTIASSFGKVFRMKREAEAEAEDSGGFSRGDDTARWAVGGGGGGGGGGGQSDLDVGVDGVDADDKNDAKATSRFTGADISRSLLYAISNNIGQIAFLQSQIHNLSQIYFGGSFIRGHRQTIATLSFAIKFWSRGSKQAYFLRHEGYLGAVGAFLKRQPRNWGRRNSIENLRAAAPGVEEEGGAEGAEGAAR